MNYAHLLETDINNGDGINVSFWVSGCPHRCHNCHNQSLWDSEAGQPFTLDTITEILATMDKPWKPDLAILGGEPLADYNIEDVTNLCMFVKRAYPDRKIWLWTGYTEREIFKLKKAEVLNYLDVIIVGRYMEELKSPRLRYRGSANQTVYKVEGGSLTFWM